MRIQRLASIVLTVVMAAGLAAGAIAQTPAPYVWVFVDNQPVAFDVPPAITGGRVLVPLRGVFERLGAIVAWDDGTQTVLAERGQTTVSLRIGSTQAMINGQPAYMDVPAMLVSGRTMVPLRFVSQALGAQVGWDAASTTVSIFSQGAIGVPPSQSYPPSQAYPPTQTYPPAPPPAVTTIQATVLSVNPPGQISVQSAGSVYTYQVTSSTAISRTNASTGAGGSVALGAIQPGDAVTITADQNGVAQAIQASYAETSGIVTALSPGVIALQNGTSYRMNPSAQVVQNNGAAATTAVLAPGETVVLRLNPLTNEVWGVRIQQAAVQSIGSVTVTPTGRSLVPGDVITVVATGPSGGTATFAITGLRANLPMAEQSGQPGTYVGTYTVQPGDFVQGAAITVQINAGGRLLTANAPATVTINGAAAVPPYGQAGAPAITSPASGSTVGIPFTVSGRAAPGARVKVTANYSGTVLLFNVNGSLGTQIVAADQNGNWAATFSQEPTVRGGMNLTITATAVDSNGNNVSPTSTVNAILQ